MLPIYAVAAAVFITGISWGLPDYTGGRLTKSHPARWRIFWTTDSPPGGRPSIHRLHFAVLALAAVPALAADAVELTHDTLARYSQLFLIGRAVSVGMALAILAFVYHLTRNELGHRSARFAVICVLLVLPLTYYAKTANFDVPYLFWLTASWLFYIRVIRNGRTKDGCLFAATGAAAIATKDQAYGFYVLPAAHLVFKAFRSRPHTSPPAIERRTVFAMTGVFVGAILILFNVPFNLSGVREHFRLIVGPGSEPFRMYPSTAAGYVQLLSDSVWQMASVISWPLFGISIIGVAGAIRSRTLLVSRLLLFRPRTS